MKKNPLTAIDFYKADHRSQYPEGTQLVYSNLTPRSSKLFNKPFFNDDIVFFGLQYFIKDFLQDTWNEGFFNRPKEEVIAEYRHRMDTSLGTGAISMQHIEDLHDLGYLPIRIKALPEGTKVPVGVSVLTIENTDSRFFWLTNYLETILSCYLWKPTTTATIAYCYRKLLDYYADTTGSPKEFVQFQGHDFSFRGMSSYQDTAISGAGHLLSFVGTDSVPAIDLLEEYYGANASEEMIGVSVPATEHSVMCMGEQEGELETFQRLINKVYPTGIVSIVSDTWDFWKVITEYLPVLKNDIITREGKVVIRPDSGDPVDILCGTTRVAPEIEVIEDYKFDDGTEEEGLKDWCVDELDFRGECSGIFKFKNRYFYASIVYSFDIPLIDEFYEITEVTSEMKGAVECLYDIFGGTVTDKGFKLLDEHIGLIYGDSITLEKAEGIMERLVAKGFASGNVVFGVGSFTYNYLTRDNLGFAVKATAGMVNNEYRTIQKDPKTDSGDKKSAKGFLTVTKENGKLVLNENRNRPDTLDPRDELKLVFEDGKILYDQTLQGIRDRLLKE